MPPATRPARRKALGQHHLRDQSLCRPAIAYLARVAPPGAPVVEIGPGGGVLTSALLAAGHSVWALELDPHWALHLRRQMRERDGVEARRGEQPSPHLRLAVADALAVDWERLPRGAAVAGNLPYQIATALIEDLLDAVHDGTIAVFLVQREVAERLAAAPGTHAYGAFSVLVQARCSVEVLARVRAGSFVPPPKVESAFVGLRFGVPPGLPTLAPHEWGTFKETVRAAFGARRKTLRNSLAASWGKEAALVVLRAAGIDGDARAETLGVDELLRLERSRRVQER